MKYIIDYSDPSLDKHPDPTESATRVYYKISVVVLLYDLLFYYRASPWIFKSDILECWSVWILLWPQIEWEGHGTYIRW